MKKRLLISAAVLVLVCGGWLLSRHVQRGVQPVDHTSASSASTPADVAVEEMSDTPERPNAETPLTPPPATNEAERQSTALPATVDLTAPDPAHVTEIRKALDELKNIYGHAGSLDWDAAKALIARRQKATEELVNRLAQLGPGGARAMGSSYTEAGSTRAKLLLVHALGKIDDAEAAGVLQFLLGHDRSFSMRKEMVLALGQRQDEAAVKALEQILAGEDDAQLRFASAQGLSGREPALPILAARLQREQSPNVRAELVHSAALVRTTAAKDLLANIARQPGDEPLRKTAIQELARNFGTSALPILETLLRDADEAIRKSAVNALARIDQTKGTQP